MLTRTRLIVAVAVIATAALTIILYQTWHKPAPNVLVDDSPSDGPERYSATVVRTVDDGNSQETTITREARSGEMLRQEWIEENGSRVLIWRPDVGKSFLLDLEMRTYVESDVGSASEPRAREDRSHDSSDDNAFQEFDRIIDEPLSPINVETKPLGDATIEGHPCSANETRAAFADGHLEVTRLFRARDLNGLALRVENISPNNIKITSERRDVSTDVPPDAFVVPADFKKVDKLMRK